MIEDSVHSGLLRKRSDQSVNPYTQLINICLNLLVMLIINNPSHNWDLCAADFK